jgi:membrane-bound serine protease (ClpP class)
MRRRPVSSRRPSAREIRLGASLIGVLLGILLLAGQHALAPVSSLPVLFAAPPDPTPADAESDGEDAVDSAAEEDAELASSPPPPLEPPTGDGPVYRLPIEGVIDLGLSPFVARAIDEAERDGAVAVLLDIDTFGGRLDAAVQIRDAVIEAPVYTIAFVHPRAISAGALISLACNAIVMAPGGSIGAATPVTGGGMDETKAADEKVISYFRTEMRATAERRGRRGDVAEAMVDPDVEIEGVIDEGKLLTLSTADALRLGIADFEARDVATLLAELGLDDAPLAERSANWAERAARVVSHPVLSSLLLSLGFLGILIELYQPGWGIPGTIGITCLLLFFLGHYVVNLAGIEEILIFVVGVLLLALEFFVIPGFGIAGVAGAIAILVSVTLALIGLDWRASWELGLAHRAMTIVASGIVGLGLGAFLFFKLMPRTRAARPFVLQHGLNSAEGYTSHAAEIEQQFPPGATGIALGDLRPAGKIRVEGQRLDAVSEGGYLDRGAAVVILAWRSGSAVVGPAPESGEDGR